MTDDEIWALRRGAIMILKTLCSLCKSTKSDKPVVILATAKGYRIPEAESKNTAHHRKCRLE